MNIGYRNLKQIWKNLNFRIAIGNHQRNEKRKGKIGSNRLKEFMGRPRNNQIEKKLIDETGFREEIINREIMCTKSEPIEHSRHVNVQKQPTPAISKMQ